MTSLSLYEDLLAPGEKLGIKLVAGREPQLLAHHQLRDEVLAIFRKRTNLTAQATSLVKGGDLPLTPTLSREGRGGEAMHSRVASSLPSQPVDGKVV